MSFSATAVLIVVGVLTTIVAVLAAALILIGIAARQPPPGEVKEVLVDDRPLTVAFDNQGAICPVCRALIPVVHDPDAVVEHVLSAHPRTRLARDLREMQDRRDEATGG